MCKRGATAVLRNLEVMAEAVRSIPADVRRKNKQVEWGQMAGTRASSFITTLE